MSEIKKGSNNMKIEMSAMEYFKTKNRMTKKCNISCWSCPYQCGYVEVKDGFCGCEDPDFDCFKCWSRPIE